MIDLPAGATPVDFAYALHTDLGHRCRGAKVDGHIVPLDTPLASGQRVEIVTAKTGGPSRDWLNAERGFVKSPRARQKIRQWFNAQAIQESVAAGRAQVEKELRRERAVNANLDQLASKLGFKQPDDLFAAVARDEVNLRQLRSALHGDQAPAEQVEVPKRKKSAAAKGGVLVVGMDSLLTQLARCCKPVPPDPVRGFVTRGKGVSVHREDCPALKRLAEAQPERLIDASWGKGGGLGEAAYAVEIGVTATDRRGLLRDIGDALAREKINVTAVRTQSRDELGLETMKVSAAALRHGVLYDLLGRVQHRDMREATVAQFMRRYHVDAAQAERVKQLSLTVYDALTPGSEREDDAERLMLEWAARLAEIGLSIAHAQYHKHSAYVLSNADMMSGSSCAISETVLPNDISEACHSWNLVKRKKISSIGSSSTESSMPCGARPRT